MKKIFYLASIAALALSSCTKDDTTGAVVNTKSGGFTISASVVSDDATTRNYLGEDDGELVPLWSKTDVIAAFSDGTASEGVFHQNVPFAIDPFDAGQRDADFLNQENGLALLGGKNLLFYYPYNAEASLPADLWNTRDSKTGVATFNADKVDFLEVKALQGYMDGSFISNMAPSIGTLSVSAVEVENGTATADVSLQPVVDYLVFKTVGTRPVEKITLQLWDEDTKTWLKIAGNGTLQEYVVDSNDNNKADTGEATRYYWVASDDADIAITLQPGTMTDIVCHEENEYVFVVPGGILGANKKIMARFEVYGDGTSTKFDYGYGKTDGSAASINGAKVGTGATAVEYWRHITNATNDQPMLADSNLENMIFYAQPKNDDGVRVPAEFNPYGDVIIRNQVELLKYFEEYEGLADNAGKKDAYICNDHVFDFSAEALGALATEAGRTNEALELEYNKYINRYYTNGFPCISEYSNTFRGNGTEENPTIIKDINYEGKAKGLASAYGLFGTITDDALIYGVTFENITAHKTTTGDATTYGVILGSTANEDAFGENVKVVAPNGEAVLGSATVANYNAIEFAEIDADVNHIVGTLNAEEDLDMTETWDVVSEANEGIFGFIAPVANEHVVFTVDGIESSAANYAELTDRVLLDADYGVASVVLAGESWWTGGSIQSLMPEDADYYAVDFAENLAAGQTAKEKAHILTKNINLNFENLQEAEIHGQEFDVVYWVGDKIAKFDLFDGDENTIRGINMYSVDEVSDATYSGSTIAPFDFGTVMNLVVDGVKIDIITEHKDAVVPEFVSGLTADAENVIGVTVKNVALNAYGKTTQNKAASYADDQYTVKLGWLVAAAQDNIRIEDCVVDTAVSNIEALAAMIARIHITNKYVDSQIKNNSVVNTSLTDEDMTAITKYAKYKANNEVHRRSYSDLVAQVWVDNADEVGIKFNGVTADPLFLVNGVEANGDKLVVYINDVVKYVFPEDF